MLIADLFQVLHCITSFGISYTYNTVFGRCWSWSGDNRSPRFVSRRVKSHSSNKWWSAGGHGCRFSADLFLQVCYWNKLAYSSSTMKDSSEDRAFGYFCLECHLGAAEIEILFSVTYRSSILLGDATNSPQETRDLFQRADDCTHASWCWQQYFKDYTALETE